MKKTIISFFLFMAVVSAFAQDPYTVLSNDDTVLTFYFDDQMISRKGHPLRPYLMPKERPWHHAANKITKVVFDTSFARYQTLTSTGYWFTLCKNLKTIVGIANLVTYQVENMTAMFDHCSSLKSIDLSHFHTSNVRGMLNMFYGCTSLTSIDLSSFNTISLLKTTGMFQECSSLTTLDLSTFKTNRLETIHSMFKNCRNLKTIYVSENWDISKLREGIEVFVGCTNLVGEKGTKFSDIHVDFSYAHVDGGVSKPGYFTLKEK